MKTKEEASEEFAVKIMELADYLTKQKINSAIITQVLKSGTSIGANISEAKYAESKADFEHKLSIAQKECNETLYWLRLLNRTKKIDESYYKVLYNDGSEILSILSHIIKKSKNHQ